LQPEKTFSPQVPAPLSDQASAHLNMLRGIAAFVVLLEHWRGVFFVNWPQVHHKNIALQLFYGSTKFGHQAVVVFFVLSGFLIGRTVLKDVAMGRWSTQRYAFHRLIRLQLVLVPALLLCWFWDATGIHLFSPSPTYLGSSGIPMLAYNVANWSNLHIFLGNLAFLQTLLVPPFGSNNPLWSLANEFWYYVLFPCLVLLLAPSSSRLRRSIAGIVLVAVALFIGWMLAGFFIWLLGVALIFLPRSRRLHPRRHSWLLLLAFAFIFVQLVFTYRWTWLESGLNTDYILSAFVAILLYLLLHDPRPVSKLYRSVASHAAGFSYTLYLTHLPFLVFFAALLNHRVLPTPRNFILPIAILLLTLAYSYGIAMLFEHNTDRIRKKLESKLGLLTKAPSTSHSR